MQKLRGFSLLELMIVVVIISILASIAYPSYRSHLMKTQRESAMMALLALADRMENYRLSHEFSYEGASLGEKGIFPNTVPVDGGKPIYRLQLNAQKDHYELHAIPVPDTLQAEDGELSLDDTGKKQWQGKEGWP